MLRTHLLLLVSIVATILILASCEPDRGDELDGKWQLRKVEYAGEVTNAVDTVWYNFQNTLFMYQLYVPATDSYHHIYGFKTWETKDRLLLELKPDPVSVESFLPMTDWATATRSFSVDKCSGGELVLRSEEVTYYFRKF